MMKALSWMVILSLIGLLTACSGQYGAQCASQESGRKMTISEARGIAQAGECSSTGTIQESYTCNEVTGTVWFDIIPDEPIAACPSPACVVDVTTRGSEVNWRCTGVIPIIRPDLETGEPVAPRSELPQ